MAKSTLLGVQSVEDIYTFECDATGSNGSADGSTLAFDISIPSGSGNRMLFVGVAFWGTGITISSVTHDGNAMTLVDILQTASEHNIAIYKLANPGTGTKSVSVTLSANPYGLIIGGWSFTGVNQSTPYGTWAEDDDYGETASLTISSANGDICVAMFFATQFTGAVGGGSQSFFQQPDPDGIGVDGTASGSTLVLSATCDGSRTWSGVGMAIKGN